MRARLLQVGHAALGQSTRFAASVFSGPVLLLLGTMLFYAGGLWVVPGLTVALLAFFALAVTINAADAARHDTPSDLCIDADAAAIAIEGRPNHGAHYTLAELERCEIVDAGTRLSIPWLVASWLTGRRVDAITRRARVGVVHLQFHHKKQEPIELAEAEVSERASLNAVPARKVTARLSRGDPVIVAARRSSP